MHTTEEVFHDHLLKRKHADTEGDILRNYDENVVLLTGTGIFRGHDGVRASAAELARYTEGMTFTYRHTLVEGEYAFLEWEATGNGKGVSDGADSFVIKNGKIVAQTIHYSVKQNEEDA